jgi:cytochrome c oxidase subunit 2
VADGPVARIQFDVFVVTLLVSLAIFLAVGTVMLIAIFRFRHRGDYPADLPLPPQVHGNVALELSLTAISVLLVAIIAFPTVQGIFTTAQVPPGLPPLEIKVTGYQWWWRFDYTAEGLSTANELVVPVGRPVKLDLRTADVIHSFWVPRLAGKMDLIPNQPYLNAPPFKGNWMWFQADKPGEYYGQCAEFCGESHAFMRFRVRAVTSDEFQKWVAEQLEEPPPPTDPEALEGKRLFMANCAQCHTVRGTSAGILGPDLTHLANRKTIAAGTLEFTPVAGASQAQLQEDAETLKNWILNNDKIKPGNRMSKANGGPDPAKIAPDVDKIVKYLMTLK